MTHKSNEEIVEEFFDLMTTVDACVTNGDKTLKSALHGHLQGKDKEKEAAVAEARFQTILTLKEIMRNSSSLAIAYDRVDYEIDKLTPPKDNNCDCAEYAEIQEMDGHGRYCPNHKDNNK